jgi:hypothetical protein
MRTRYGTGTICREIKGRYTGRDKSQNIGTLRESGCNGTIQGKELGTVTIFYGSGPGSGSEF